MQEAVRWCPECSAEQPFEQPPCPDGHGLDCLDLACVVCGFAVVLGPLVAEDTELDAPVTTGARAA